MSIGKTLKDKISYRIKRSKAAGFIFADFADLSNREQIGRALRKLVQEGILVKLGQGVFAKTIISTLSDKRILATDFSVITRQVLKKFYVKTGLSRAEREHNAGISTQMPTGLRIGVNKRVYRKLSYNGRSISYERFCELVLMGFKTVKIIIFSM